MGQGGGKMTTYSIPAPDGKTYEIDGPEGASQEAIRTEVIRQHPHLAAVPKSLVDQIPGGENAPPPTVKPTPSIYQRALGLAEVIPGMVGGMVAGVAGPVANVIGNVTSGSFGSPAGVRAGQQLQTRAEQAVGYKPVTQAGAENLQTVGEALAPLVGVPIPTMNALAGSLGPAVNALKARTQLTAVPAINKMLSPAKSEMVGMGAASTELPIQRQTMAESARIPLKLSKGQATRNLEQQQFEHETTKTYPETEGKPLALQQQKLNEDFLRNFDASAEAMGGEIHGETQLRPVGKVVDEALVKRFKEAKAEVKKKYDAADKAGETQEQVAIAPLYKYIADHETEIATNNAPMISNLKMTLDKLGLPETLSIQDLEKIRSKQSQLSFPGSGVNEVHMGELRPLFEGITEGKGGDLYKAARAENVKYATEFKDHAIVSKLLRNKPGTKDRAVAFEDIYDHAVHGGSFDDLQHIQNILLKGGDEGKYAWDQIRAQAANELKQRAMTNISRDAAGNPIPNAKALRNSVAQLDRDGKLDLLFGKEEAQRVRDLVSLGADIYSPVPGTISPGTASVLIRSLDMIAKNALVSRIPVVRSVASGVAELAQKSARKKRVGEAINYNALADQP